MSFARVTVLCGALAVFMTLQGCGEPAKEPAKEPEKKEAAPATAKDLGKMAARMEVLEQKPLGDDQLKAAKMHTEAAKMQLEAAKMQHSDAGAKTPLPEIEPKDAFKDIPYDPPSKPRESSKYLNSIPPLSKHNYHDTLQSSKLGAPPAAVEAKWNADPKPYKPPPAPAPRPAIRAAVEPKPMPTPSEPLEESVYGYVMASLISDSADIKVHGLPKIARIGSAFGLFLIMFFTQVFLLVQTKRLVSPLEVKNAREVYGKYEKLMYTNLTTGESHTWKTVNGYDRGIDGFFIASNFDKLKHEEKNEMCSIPLSQPWFLLVILCVWALAVLDNLRTATNLVLRFLSIPSTRGNQSGLTHHHTAVGYLDDEDHRHQSGLQYVDDGFEVVGLAVWLKVSLVVFILIPRMIMCGFLMWLGARWLTATLGYADVLLNSLALVLILDLAELVYKTVVPFHGKRLVQSMYVPHVRKEEPENCQTMFGMIFLGVFAFALSALYMTKLQQVLPGYKWDVHLVCQGFLDKAATV